MNKIKNAPQSVEQTKNNRKIIGKNALEKAYITPFIFESEILNSWCKFVKTYNISNYRQIEIQAVQCFSAIIAYCGQPNLPFFLLDLSDSGTGKSSNKRFQFDILFKPIKDELDLKFKNSDNKELLSFLMENKATYEGIYETAINQPKFFVDLGEVGNALKNKDTKTTELLNMLTDKNGTNNILRRPVYKNAKALPPMIENAKFYLSADTNIQQLGGNDSVIKEYLGGLFNRFIINYTKDILSYENSKFNANRPHSVEIQKFEKFITSFMGFYKQENYEIDINLLKDNSKYDEFCRIIHTKKQNGDDEYKELYNRVVQNLNAIIQTLHYLKQYEYMQKTNFKFQFSHKVSDETIHEAIRFILPYIDFTLLFSEINKQANAIGNIRQKMIEYIVNRIQSKGSCKIYDIAVHRSFKDYKTDEIRAILKDFITENSDKTITII